MIKTFIIELEMDDAQARKRKRIEEMRKKPTQKPDFKSLMKDIDSFRYGFKTKLKKTHCNDRSQPFIGSGLKVQGKVSTRDYCAKFATGINIIISHSSKSI